MTTCKGRTQGMIFTFSLFETSPSGFVQVSSGNAGMALGDCSLKFGHLVPAKHGEYGRIQFVSQAFLDNHE